MIIRREGDEYVVYDGNGKEVARFDTLGAADAAFPDAQPAPTGWEPGQPLPAPSGTVPVAGAEGAAKGTPEKTRWVEPTKTKPGHWEIQETAMGQTRWRDMTFDEFQAAEWQLEPGPLSPEFLRARFEQGPFAELGPTAAPVGGAGGAGGGAVQAVEPTAEEIAQQEFLELNAALERKGITADEFQFALAYHLSLSDIRQMQTMGITQEEAAPGLVRGLTISDLSTAKLLDVPVTDYIWARTQGLTDADIRNATLTGQSLPEMVDEAKTTGAAGQAQAEFEDIWAKRTAGISEGILNVPGVTPALTREGARAQTEYVRRRTTELATAALEQPVPGAAAKPEPLPSETGIPSTEELLTRVARGGVVPLYVEGREPLPGGFRPSERAVARTGPGGPPQAGGLGVLGPGGLYGFNPLGDWFAQQQMKAGFEKQAQEKQARTPEGEKYAQAYIGTLGPLTPKTEPLPGEEPKKKKEKLGLAAIS